jgi:hypothetical protein
MGFWKSEDAERRFGEVMHRALTHAPQTVVGPGPTAVVVMSEGDHHRLVLAVQRLVELGETPPGVRARLEGEQSAWEFIESLPPMDEDGEPGFPEGFFEQMREEARHCECCAQRGRQDRTAAAAD